MAGSREDSHRPLFAWMAVGLIAALLLELLANGSAIRFAIGRLAVTSVLAVDGALVAVFVSSPRSCWHGAALNHWQPRHRRDRRRHRRPCVAGGLASSRPSQLHPTTVTAGLR